MCHFQICPEQNVLVQTIIIIFIYILALFIRQNLKNILTANPELWGCIIFGPKMVHLLQTKYFFWKKSLISFSSTYWPLLLCKILNKFLQQIQSYDGASVLITFPGKLLITLVPFIQAYLRAKNRSQIFIY